MFEPLFPCHGFSSEAFLSLSLSQSDGRRPRLRVRNRCFIAALVAEIVQSNWVGGSMSHTDDL